MYKLYKRTGHERIFLGEFDTEQEANKFWLRDCGVEVPYTRCWLSDKKTYTIDYGSWSTFYEIEGE